MRQLSRRTTPTHSQNIFRSGALVDRLIDKSSISSGDLVYDLGAGTGVIANRLTRIGCEVVAVEREAALAARLRVRFSGVSHVEVRECDVLQLRLPRRPYKVFSNIPFDVTAGIITRLTRAAHSPHDAYVVVQREAAARFIGYPHATLAAVLLFPWYEASLFHEFRRTDFAPVPRVEVVMLRLRKRGPPLIAPDDPQLYRDFVVRLFTGAGVSVRDRLAPLLGYTRARRLTRVLTIGDALPRHVPTDAWVELFKTSASLMGDELRWRVAHAERTLHGQHRRLHKVHRMQSTEFRTRADHRPPRPLALGRIRPDPGRR